MKPSTKGGNPARRLIQRYPLVPIGILLLLIPLSAYHAYNGFRIDVPAKHFAVLTKKTGKDLGNSDEIAPGPDHKGLQLAVLSEGRYFRNPFFWGWEIYPMVEIPRDKMGIRIRLHGEDLPYGHFVATSEAEKGIIQEPLRPGRYAINGIVVDGKTKKILSPSRPKSDFAEIVELWEPTIIPAGFKGVVTNLSGDMPEDPNLLLVESGKRGAQAETLEAGTYYLNPYMNRINAIDTRSQRFNLTGDGYEMGFPSKDGFWISLEGIIEFRVRDERAAELFVTYNDDSNDTDHASVIAEEIIAKVIMPNARAFCRLRGSDSSGREFIGGVTRTAFQEDFEDAIRATCEKQGIEIVQALITRIKPPQTIAEPVREREIAAQELSQYVQQKLQQDEEAKLATEVALVSQRTALVEADRDIIEMINKAQEEQAVQLAAANRDMEVAEQQLEAAKDKAEAILAAKRAEAAVIGFENEADAAGWKMAVEALGNDGDAYARYILYQKLAPGYRSIMTNTADSPLMRIFEAFEDPPAVAAPQPAPPQPQPAAAPVPNF